MWFHRPRLCKSNRLDPAREHFWIVDSCRIRRVSRGRMRQSGHWAGATLSEVLAGAEERE